ncbi:MAG: AAA family ATPase [Methylococcaceae bacterium]|nr:AAA family ATPase [Methylococcaceae bacterium]
MQTTIKQIKISGFKSIADVELNDLSPYSVFAGANGSGKSNFFDALAFVSVVVRMGVIEALRKFGGYGQVHCHTKPNASVFAARFDLVLDEKSVQYDLTIQQMDKSPALIERLVVDGSLLMSRHPEAVTCYVNGVVDKQYLGFPAFISALILTAEASSLLGFLSNTIVYRIDPIKAKQSHHANTDTNELDQDGRNIAAMLADLEKEADIREQILEWMTLLVPGLQDLGTEHQKLDGSTLIKFTEQGSTEAFPAHLISDGTIYALCIMTAVLNRSTHLGMTLIEEPERGIHPKAIAELVNLMRDNAQVKHPIFVSTHNESVVRAAESKELWLVDKKDGKTVFSHAAQSFVAENGLKLDEAWLMNMFDGGLPW